MIIKIHFPQKSLPILLQQKFKHSGLMVNGHISTVTNYTGNSENNQD